MTSPEEKFIQTLEDLKEKPWTYIVQPDAEYHRMLEKNARKKKKALREAIRRALRATFHK